MYDLSLVILDERSSPERLIKMANYLKKYNVST